MRKLHFVGTMPQFATAKAALSWELDEIAEHLDRVHGGETGPRSQWFVPVVKELKRLPQVVTVRSGDWTDYDDVDRLKVPLHARLRPEDVPLRFAEHALEELEVLGELGAALPLQVGVPGYLDLALFTFGPTGVIRHGRTFLRAVAEELSRIRAASDNVVFQLEVPAALIAVLSAPAPLRPLMADTMARFVTAQVRSAPEGSRFGVHLCLGDMGHKALKQLKDTGPLVLLANALVRRWPEGRTLEFVHLPMSGGDVPPTTKPEFYAPLRKLVPCVRVIAGIAHEEQSYEDQLVVRGLVEEALGRPVDIATSCGLGRRTPEAAERATKSMLALLD
ncbi:hypothetical protein [Lentzea sp. NPDC092896]|uniref:hypothetical protein n=1 Tax=Lentzea sp. NPDC092896 TaxID=3364127 RepID=UPI00381788BC